jgi:hypothetical protein
MNTTNAANKNNLTTTQTITAACLGACEKIATEIREVKGRIFAEFKGAFENHELLLQLSLAEADALARQTEYPHLFFPLLATEKLQVAVQRQSRQQQVRRNSPVYALTA